jgi:hypothetical protein
MGSTGSGSTCPCQRGAVSDWSWKHAERRNAEGKWVPAIRVTYAKGQLFNRYLPGWSLFDTQEEARAENERVASGFAEKIGLPAQPST